MSFSAGAAWPHMFLITIASGGSQWMTHLRYLRTRCVYYDLPAGRSPKNCCGMQRGSAQVTADRLAGESRKDAYGAIGPMMRCGGVNPTEVNSDQKGRGEALAA